MFLLDPAWPSRSPPLALIPPLVGPSPLASCRHALSQAFVWPYQNAKSTTAPQTWNRVTPKADCRPAHSSSPSPADSPTPLLPHSLHRNYDHQIGVERSSRCRPSSASRQNAPQIRRSVCLNRLARARNCRLDATVMSMPWGPRWKRSSLSAISARMSSPRAQSR